MRKKKMLSSGSSSIRRLFAFFILLIGTHLVNSWSLSSNRILCSWCWQMSYNNNEGRLTKLYAKGFNKARNRQAELAKKMELAKKQQSENQDIEGMIPEEKIVQLEEPSSSSSSNNNNNNNKDRVDQQHEIFQKLLDTTQGAIPTDVDTDSAYIGTIKAGKTKTKMKKKSKPKEEPKKKQGKVKQEQERNNAQRIHFESLLDIETKSCLGSIGAAQLVPWVPPYLNDYLIVFADPRSNSGDLRQTIKYLTSLVTSADGTDNDDVYNKKSIIDQVICITADSVLETKSWLKRSNVSPPFRIFSDPQLTWMTQYKVLPSEEEDNFPWAMTVITFDTNGDFKLNRMTLPSHSTQFVLDRLYGDEH